MESTEGALLATNLESSLLLPDLVEVWDYLSTLPRLDLTASVQQGRQYWEQNDLEVRGLLATRRKPGWDSGDPQGKRRVRNMGTSSKGLD